MRGGEVEADIGRLVHAGLLVPAELAVADLVADEVGVDARGVVAIVLGLKKAGKFEF